MSRSKPSRALGRPLLAILLPRAAAARAVVRGWQAGEAVLPLDPAAPAAELRRTLAALRPTHLLDGHGRATLPGGEPVGEDIAAVVVTSGTTGTPKGVELTAAGIEASAGAVSAAISAGPGDRWLACVPLHAVAGLAIVARAWHSDLPIDVHERFDAGLVDRAAREGSATLVSLVPTMLARLLDSGADLGRFRRILLGGGSPPPGLLARAADRGAAVVATYGLTETFGGVAHDGRPLPGVELSITAEGEIAVRGPVVMRRYRHDPAGTRAALRGGLLRTGDLGRIRPDGRLEVLGRRDDLVISGGVSVQPAEVEMVLGDHPAVAEVAVAGVPDAQWGQRLVAYVVPEDMRRPPSLEELRAHARDRLATAKAPRELVVMDELPRNPSGKILRRRLAGLALATGPRAVAAQPPGAPPET